MSSHSNCQALVNAFHILGYTEYLGPLRRGAKSGDAAGCSRGYIFYPKGSMTESHNYQMFRGYVHDTEDVVYLRINIPGIKHGLGREPAKFDPTHRYFVAQIAEFCETVSVSKFAFEELRKEQEKRRGSTIKKEKIICSLCKGTKTDLHRQKLYPDLEPLECKLCKGTGDRFLITETYYTLS